MPDNMFKGSYEGASSTGSEQQIHKKAVFFDACLLYTSPSPRD